MSGNGNECEPLPVAASVLVTSHGSSFARLRFSESPTVFSHSSEYVCQSLHTARHRAASTCFIRGGAVYVTRVSGVAAKAIGRAEFTIVFAA